MKNPYEVLGISPNATDDEVKSAYRQMAKKYHPDNYVDSPLGDLAEEKMKEINEAYDAILEQRKNAGSSGNSQAGAYRSGGYGGSQFYTIRTYIMNGRIFDADNMLEQIPEQQRNAEWYFLKGTVFYKKGWSDQAYSYFQRATQMDPGNAEYRQAFNRINVQRQNPTGGYSTGGSASQCTCCDVCNALFCANCCCNCLGGGC